MQVSLKCTFLTLDVPEVNETDKFGANILIFIFIHSQYRYDRYSRIHNRLTIALQKQVTSKLVI